MVLTSYPEREFDGHAVVTVVVAVAVAVVAAVVAVVAVVVAVVAATVGCVQHGSGSALGKSILCFLLHKPVTWRS